MKRVLTVMLSVVAVLCMAFPITAFAFDGKAVTVTARDDAGMPLSGMTVGIFQGNNLVAQLVTDQNGTAVSIPLTEGEYYLAQFYALPGLVQDTTSHRFTITESGVVMPINIINQRIVGVLSVRVTDGTNPITGVTFGIFKNNIKIDELTTGYDGTATSGALFYGSYELRAITVTSGYELYDMPLVFSVTTQSELVCRTIFAAKSVATVKIIKTGENGERLRGVAFDVYNSDTYEKLTTVTTDSTGIVSLDLPLGRCFLKETKTADGYILAKDNIPFTLKTSGETVAVTVQGQKKPLQSGVLRIIKKADDTGTYLSGATFGIYDTATGGKVKETTTNKDGTVTVDLTEGSYYLLELKPPAGYELNRDKVNFPIQGGDVTEITSKGKAIAPEVTPTPTPAPTPTPKPAQTPTPTNPTTSQPTTPSTNGTLQLYVHGEQSGSKLSGASFTVYRANGEKVTDINTNSGGTATLSLSAGDYYLKQTKAATGFMRETVKIPFIVKASATTVVDVTNMKSDMPVIDIPKTGEDYPTLAYALSALFMGIAVMCGATLYRKRKIA